MKWIKKVILIDTHRKCARETMRLQRGAVWSEESSRWWWFYSLFTAYNDDDDDDSDREMYIVDNGHSWYWKHWSVQERH